MIFPSVIGGVGDFYKDYVFGDGFDVVEFHRNSVFRLLFLSVYFFIISVIFKTIKVNTLFSYDVIKLLKRFTLLNVLPFLYSLIYNITTYGETWFFESAFLGNFMYISIGLISLFMTGILKKGYEVQTENELTI